MSTKNLRPTRCPEIISTLVIDAYERPLRSYVTTEELRSKRLRSQRELSAECLVGRQDSPSIIFKEKFDGYQPKDLRVTFTDGVLEISGRRREEGKYGSVSEESFVRKFRLDEGTKEEDIQPSIDEDGNLVVSIRNVKPLEDATHEKVIPIGIQRRKDPKATEEINETTV